MSVDLDERILVHAPTGRDGPLAAELLRGAGHPAECCPTIDRLCDEASRGAAAALVAEESLDRRGFTRLERWVAAQPAWSDLPILMLSSGERSFLSAAPTMVALAPFGNVTILERPMRAVVLLSAVHAASRARRRQYEVRDLVSRLERGLEDREAFIATLSHELRNPLAAIRNALAIVDGARTDDVETRAHSVLRRQSLHVSRLVDDLLDVSRITAGKIVLQSSAVDLGGVVRRGVETMVLAEHDEHHIELDIADGVLVRGDPVRLEQIVGNLLTNAVKYTPAGGRIDVELRSEAGQAVLVVRDQGEGLSPAMRDRVFQMFAQADRTLDRARGGLGIGLNVTLRLVELHGGAIEVTSEGEGRGTTFVVRLPLLSPGDALPAEERGAGSDELRVRAAIHRVVLVEDNDDIRETLSVLLARHGYTVEVAADGPTGVAVAISHRPDAVVVDIGLPGFDGYEVARRLRRTLPPTTVLVALSGYGQPEDRVKSQDAGFDVHLTKPVDIDVLATALAG